MPGEPPPTCDDSTPEEQVGADDLIHAARAMGADKNVNHDLQLERPTRRLSRVFGTVKGDAPRIAVQVTGPPADPLADGRAEPARRAGR